MNARDLNLAMWEERVPLHLASSFYDLPGFKAGRNSLQPFEHQELGAVHHKELIHLQCHIGLDTLSWARLGARVSGLDFSPRAVNAAQQLAAELELPARFVCSDVYDAKAALDAQFDIVYTGIGALIWLPDIQRWADVVCSLLKPGGVFYMVECHPITDSFAADSLEVTTDYFHDSQGTLWEGTGSYADASAATTHNQSVEFRHPLGDVVTALVSRGLRLTLLREHDYTVFQRWPFLVRKPDGSYRIPEDKPRLPLLYSLRAVNDC